jgi:hypothetical protein
LTEKVNKILEKAKKITEKSQQVESEDAREAFELARPLLPLYNRVFAQMAYELDQLSTLVKALPDAKAQAAEIEKVKLRLSGVETNFHELPTITKQDLHDKRKQAQVDDSMLKYFEFSLNFMDFIRGNQKLFQDILRKAEDDRNFAERWYNKFTDASYALFSIGWGMGLLGKLYGIKGLAGGE